MMNKMVDSAQLGPERLRLLRRAEYDQLVELGAFQNERIELLRGALVTMSPQKPPHANVPAVLHRHFVVSLGDRAVVRSHSPLALGEWSEPEPDLALVPPGNYVAAHPTTAFLVVEVADSSLRKDRHIKAELYAEHGIPEYWIVNLAEQVVEVHTDPKNGRYRVVVTRGATESISPLAFPDVTVHLNAVFD
jgi:Uma2 family endonuclease